jgi:hypothetical protein
MRPSLRSGWSDTMPCFRCGTRQNDPPRGASLWRRGVRGGEQVLICPECQRTTDWTALLDRCGYCGSTALGRRLGEVTCRDCGRSAPSAAELADTQTDAPPLRVVLTAPRVDSPDPELAAQVNAALDRLFGRR